MPRQTCSPQLASVAVQGGQCGGLGSAGFQGQRLLTGQGALRGDVTPLPEEAGATPAVRGDDCVEGAGERCVPGSQPPRGTRSYPGASRLRRTARHSQHLVLPKKGQNDYKM